MNETDKGKLITEIDSRWPLKFEDADLRHYADKLAGYDLADVQHALSAHKADSRFAPKLPEIIKRLPKLDPKQRQSFYRTGLARSIVATQRHLDGRNEAELIVRNYRYFAWVKTKNPDTGAVEFYEGVQEDRLPRLKRECIDQLIAAGWELEHATNAAEWIAMDKVSFEQQFVADLNASRVSEECPI